MLNNELAAWYERDIRRLIGEIRLFKQKDDLWKTKGDVKNAAGNLALHIMGGLNNLIGATLAKSGYVRDRDQEFSRKDVDTEALIAGLEALIPMIAETLNALTPEAMEEDYPVFFDKPQTSVGYVLLQLLTHLNYHLGQVNYLRRLLA